jgi:hypothetical protein
MVNGVAATQPTMTTTIDAAKTHKPIQLSSFRAAKMWLRFGSNPVVNTNVTWMTMKSRNHTNTRKCSDRAV